MDTFNLTRSATLDSIKFPQLGPRYQGMPRRYEETKPVVIQDFTHRRIIVKRKLFLEQECTISLASDLKYPSVEGTMHLVGHARQFRECKVYFQQAILGNQGIGHDIQRRLLDRLDVEKSEAIQAAEEATWEQAEKKKHSAVRKVRDEASQKIDKALQAQRKELEQKNKEDVVRVEMAMQKQAIEQVQEERAKGEKALAAAVKQVEERCALELEKAVAEAHLEEQRIAAENIKNLTQKHNAEIEDINKEHVVELAEQLALLTAKKDAEHEETVKKAHEFEQKVTRDVVEKLQKRYEAEIVKEASKIHDKVHVINRLTKQMEEIEQEKERLAEFLKMTRKGFQDFIDRVQKVKKGEADFMLPPAYIDEIESGLMEAVL